MESAFKKGSKERLKAIIQSARDTVRPKQLEALLKLWQNTARQ